MAEELQHLLETIQKDGVEKANAEAEKILEDARAKARDIVEEAKKDAEKRLQEADEEAKAFAERGEKALEQAARDTLISVGREIQTVLKAMIVQEVGKALDIDTLRNILSHLATNYFDNCLHSGPVVLQLNKKDAEALSSFFTDKLRDQVKKGLTVNTPQNVKNGFKISLKEDELYHDFTQEAIAEEISRYLQPRLQKVISEVVQKEQKA